mgnify:CR=1 FL=1
MTRGATKRRRSHVDLNTARNLPELGNARVAILQTFKAREKFERNAAAGHIHLMVDSADGVRIADEQTCESQQQQQQQQTRDSTAQRCKNTQPGVPIEPSMTVLVFVAGASAAPYTR